MNFRFDDNSKVISHWMPEDDSVCDAIIATKEFKASGATVAEVRVNGVPLDFSSLERFLAYQVNEAVTEATLRFSDLDKEVERRLSLRIEQEAQKVLDKMDSIRQTLEDASSIIKPYWEK